MAVKIDFRLSMPSPTGGGFKAPVNGSSIKKWSDKQAAIKLAEGRKTLRSAAAYARAIMRKSIKKGTYSKEQKQKQKALRVGGVQNSKMYRKPSQAGRPPKYWTQGRQFGIRTIIFSRLTPDSYAIGAVVKNKGRARFKTPEMLEFGGRGQVKMPASFSDVGAEAGLWSRISRAGGKAASIWKSARYPARPYASPAVKPTVEKFHDIFGR